MDVDDHGHLTYLTNLEKKNIAFEILNQYYDWQKETMYEPASLFIWTIQITDV